MELIKPEHMPTFVNSGVASQQLLFAENSQSARVTLTRVRMPPGAINPRHAHETSEQIWLALEGAATLLLADNTTASFAAGEVARFAEGDIHGLSNTDAVDFVYMSITSPPINFRQAYATPWVTS